MIPGRAEVIIECMDAYLSGQARKELELLNITGSPASGYLMGHRRGHRFIIERIHTMPDKALIDLEKAEKLDEISGRKLIGVFSQDVNEPLEATILVPYFTGRMYLKIETGPDRLGVLNPFLIDFEGDYVLIPIRMNQKPEGKEK